jgi:uncharacterized membrane-anchored protein
VRLLVLDRRLTPSEAGALVRRLLEVETYRTLALLGLPEAEAAGPVIRRKKGGGVNHPSCGWQESKHDKADR